MKYRKKPLVIDAVQWTGLNLEEVKTFAKGSLDVEIFDAGWKAGAVKPSVKITIHTLEGDMIVNSGDYIIKGVDGEIYPCKPDIFIKTYEKVDAMIEAQPTVGQWIPCSERLPDDYHAVNVTWVNRNPEPYYMHIKDKPFTATACYHNRSWYWYSSVIEDLIAEYDGDPLAEIDDGIEIIAWQPLPEPYREGK